jgi:transcriptional regulator with XRE-family HTH domain
MGVETPPRRLKRAREAVGLDEHAVARLAGITSPWYYDLETHDDELASTLSLEKLCHLAEIVRTDPLVLLIGDRASTVERSIEFGDVVRRLTTQMATSGLDVEQFGERVGWELGKILADPNELWELNTDGFRDVATAAGVDWSSAFPRTRRSTAGVAV